MLKNIPEKYDLDEVLAWLTAIDYRITKPLVPRTRYSDSEPPSKLLKAAILDTETTGLRQATDKIIELGIVFVEYSPETGQVYRVLEIFNELEDPGMPIPAESTKIHGITDDMVHGKKIDDTRVAALMSDVTLVIAHNAAFDRTFVESRLPLFQKKPWACSLQQIPWREEGMGSSGLEYLAYRCGFHFSGHRASIDCQALLEVLQSELPKSSTKAFKALLEKARIPETKIWTLGAPFDNKDKLKERGYRWDGERKLWNGTVSQENVPQEVDWLREFVYENRPFKLELEKIDALNRFTTRRGATEIVSY